MLVYLLFASFHRFLEYAYEDMSYALHPSAERAFEIGERHFDGQNIRAYDIERATDYFLKAEQSDSSLLYIHHEIARIHFLKGNFWDAMAQINIQIEQHGSSTPNSYYVRGLIEGYMGNYDAAAKDYEVFLKVDPRNWAAINDYAWILLKAGRATEAAAATEEGLRYFPHNPWLLNSSAIALYEIGDLKKAHTRILKAWGHVQTVSQAEWLHSYPGNDPAIASQGIATFHASVAENMRRIELALASSTRR